MRFIVLEIDWAATGAMIGGIATAVYAIFTWLLWKTSQEILTQTQKLHLDDTRPWINIIRLNPGFKFVNSPDLFGPARAELPSSVRVEIKNQGRSPARITVFHAGFTNGAEPERLSVENYSTVLMPDESSEKDFGITWPAGVESMRFSVEVKYGNLREEYRSLSYFVVRKVRHDFTIEREEVDYV